MQRWLPVVVCAVLLLGCRKPGERPVPPGDYPSSTIRARVDTRVETLSILCWLAEYPEYQDARATPYRLARQPLERFRDHPAVAATRELRTAAGIAYNAPVSLAVYLDEHLAPLVSWSPPPAGLDKRWHDVNIAAYLTLVRAFARDAGLRQFFAGQRPYLERVEAAYQGFLDANPIRPWIDHTLGVLPHTDYVVMVGMQSGPQNYGARTRVGNTETFFQLISLVSLDRDGIPQTNMELLRLLVHETLHSYVDPVLDERQDELRTVGQAAFDRVAEEMSAQAYGEPLIMCNETVVRALTVLHMSPGYPRSASQEEKLARTKSFLWIGEVRAELERRLARNGRLTDEDLVAAARDGMTVWLASTTSL